ncbi:MAG: hypothetical protein IJU26_05145 [Synergistaceae bacterium]|nr:hypothetical protein [Synergistaceae bacterium]
MCGHISANHIAPDDNPVKLISIAMKPVTCPPFPVEHMEELAERINAE